MVERKCRNPRTPMEKPHRNSQSIETKEYRLNHLKSGSSVLPTSPRKGYNKKNLSFWSEQIEVHCSIKAICLLDCKFIILYLVRCLVSGTSNAKGGLQRGCISQDGKPEAKGLRKVTGQVHLKTENGKKCTFII